MSRSTPATAHTTGPRPLRRSRLLLALAVLGPGLLAGLSDDDPAGITTYSVLGADYGYRLLWVLLLSTAALILFHNIGARMGVVTGQGLIGLIRQRYGVGIAGIGVTCLVVANLGTACAEFAGLAAGFEVFGVSRLVAVPVAAALLTTLVLGGGFHRIEHVLLALSAVFVAYVGAGLVAGPDWGAAARGLLVPTMPVDQAAVLIVAATVGTTLAPWGLSFIQSYAVDKKLTVQDLRYERIDVVTGSVLTGVIGFFVVVACAETLNSRGVSIESAADAARALRPLAGRFAGQLFAVGLVGAALLAAAVLPMSTAYSVCEYVGAEAALDSRFRDARLFYISNIGVTAVAAGVVLLPHVPLVDILVLTQALNAALLLPLLLFVYGVSRDRDLMGDYTVSSRGAALQVLVIAGIAACVLALFVLQ